MCLSSLVCQQEVDTSAQVHTRSVSVNWHLGIPFAPKKTADFIAVINLRRVGRGDYPQPHPSCDFGATVSAAI